MGVGAVGTAHLKWRESEIEDWYLDVGGTLDEAVSCEQ